MEVSTAVKCLPELSNTRTGVRHLTRIMSASGLYLGHGISRMSRRFSCFKWHLEVYGTICRFIYSVL